jgi:cytochrome c-type biogenesis protein CcmH
MKLSAFDTVLVEVRVSKSGNATPQRGDLEGQAGPLPNRSAAIELLIDRVRQ